jgi:hypothetical protein
MPNWLARVLAFAFGTVAAVLVWSSFGPIRTSDAVAPTSRPSSSAPGPVDIVLETPDDRPPTSTASHVVASPTPVTAPAATKAPQALGAVVFGSILDDEGNELPRSTSLVVAFSDAEGHRHLADANDGRYAIAGLHEGTWRAVCGGGVWSTEEKQLELTAGEPQRIDFGLGAKLLLRVAVVTEDGTPLFEELLRTKSMVGLDIGAVATRDPPGERLPPTVLSFDRNFGVARFASRHGGESPGQTDWIPADIGALDLRVAPPFHVSLVLRHFVLATQRVDDVVERVEFRIPVARLVGMLSGLRLRVVDAESGEPLSKGRFTLMTAQAGLGECAPNDNGEVVFENCPPGQVELLCSVPDHAYTRREIGLEPGSTTDLGTLALVRPVAIRGTFVDSSGGPLAVEAHLNAYTGGDPRAMFARTADTTMRSTSEGEFKAESLAPGLYVIRVGEDYRNPPGKAEPMWSMSPQLIDTRGGPREDLRFVLAPTVEVEFRAPSNNSIGLNYMILTEDGLPYRRASVWQVGPDPLRLAPGRYRVVISDKVAGVLREVPIEVGSSRVEVLVTR